MQAQAAQATQQATQATQAAQATPGGGVVVNLPQVSGAPVIVSPEGRVIMPGGSSPSALYDAARNQRSELRSQLEQLQDQRQDITRQMEQSSTGPVRSGLEQRLAQVDERIASVDKQLASADEAVARLAAVPGAIVRTPPPRQSGPPEEFWVISGLILVPSAFILTIAYARRIWRRSAKAVTALPQEVFDRFTRVEQAIDSVAVEVERIGEGQRYLTRVLAEKQLGPGAVQPVEQKQREGERVARER